MRGHCDGGPLHWSQCTGTGKWAAPHLSESARFQSCLLGDRYFVKRSCFKGGGAWLRRVNDCRLLLEVLVIRKLRREDGATAEWLQCLLEVEPLKEEVISSFIAPDIGQGQ